MINILKTSFNSLNPKIKKIMKIGLYFSLFISIISAIILALYIFKPLLLLYYTGIFILKFSIVTCTSFIICGFVIDAINNGY